jgi:hypothetical protein
MRTSLPPAAVWTHMIKSIGKVYCKNIWKYYEALAFREGSISMPKAYDVELKGSKFPSGHHYSTTRWNNIELTLDGVNDFINNHYKDLGKDYKVFKEQFRTVLAGNKEEAKGQTYFSLRDIEPIKWFGGKTILIPI